MKRITFDGLFCDIAKCQEIICHYGKDCSQKRVWERLKAIEDVLGEEYDLEHFRDLTKKIEAAEQCIYSIEDALDRGTDNDWAREAIEEYEKAVE